MKTFLILLRSNTATVKSNNQGPDTYEEYKRKNGLYSTDGYAKAVNALYASSKRDLSSYGLNNRDISNKGLQNSGYASYIDSLAKDKFDSGLASIKDTYAKKEYDASIGYQGYLDQYRDKANTLKKSVMSHLIASVKTDFTAPTDMPRR